MTYITQFFSMIFDWINGLTGSYGWSIVLFTILFRLVFSPLDIRSRVGQRQYTKQLAKIQPQMDVINKAYKNDPQKAQAKIMALRKQEGIGMMPKGCVTMLLTYPILIAFFAVFRNLAGQHMAELATVVKAGGDTTSWFNANGFLWIKNIWQPDVTFNFSEIWGVRKIWIINGINGYVIPNTTELKSVLTSAYRYSTELKSAFGSANDLIAYAEPLLAPLRSSGAFGGNGFYILPFVAGAAQMLQMFMTPQAQPAGTDPQAQQAAKTGNFMKIFFPILFVYFCLVSSSALAIYWITSSLCMILLTFILNRYFDRKDKKEAEAEKE